MPHVKKYHTRSANKKLTEPSTSKEPPDLSEAKTPEHADRNAKTPDPENPNPPRPESPDNCSICLSTVENKSFTDSCLHTFCYVCLLEWSKVKAVCPLCKQNFKKIIYNVRSLDDFDEYVLPPPQPQRDHLWENFNAATFARFRYRTTLTQDRLDYVHRRRHPAGLGGLRGPTSRVITREEVLRRRRQQAIQNRRRIYDYDMWVRPVSPTSVLEHDYDSRYRETSPAFFTENDAARYALIPWLSRELNILLHGTEDNVHFVLELILDLIQRFEIRSDEFFELVHPLVGRHSRHFIHELYHFARSPYDLATYDQRATYESRPGVPVPEVNNESEDDDVMVVDSEGPSMSESGAATQTLSQILSRESGVPLSNIGPIDVTWNISSTLGDVRAFLQNAMAEETGFGLFSSGAAQMARIESQHNYASGRAGSGASSTTPTDSTPTTQTVNVDDDSDDDVIFVKYEKPYAERSPIVLSSGSDTETAASDENRRRHKHRRHDKVRRPHRSRSRSGHRSSGARSEVRRRLSGERSHRERRSRSRDKRSRSRDRRSRSRDRRSRAREEGQRSRDREQESRHRRSRSRDRRSRSRDLSSVLQNRRSRSRSPGRRSRSRERTHSRDPRSQSGDHSSRSHHSSRHRRSRSRDRDVRHRSRHETRRRHSSSDSVEITRVKRRKAKKHKKHKKTHKRRRVSPTRPEVEEPSTSGERKYKKHPTGHKNSKTLSSVVVRPEPEARTLASVVVKPTVAEPVLSSGFESGDHSGDSPIDVTTVTDDVTNATDDVSKCNVTDDVSKCNVTDDVAVANLVTFSSTPGSIVRSLLDDLIDTVTSKDSEPCSSTCNTMLPTTSATASTSGTKPGSNTEQALLGLLDLAWNKNGYGQKPASPALATRLASPPANPIQHASHAQTTSASPAQNASPLNLSRKASPARGAQSPARSPRTYPVRPTTPDSDSDCIMNADDDVVFEGECRCRARQKCAKCLHSSDSSSDEDSHDSLTPRSSPTPAKSRTYLPKTALPDVSCFVTIGNLIGNLGHSSRTQDSGCHRNQNASSQKSSSQNDSTLVDLDSDGSNVTIDVENSSDHEIDIVTVEDPKNSSDLDNVDIVIDESGNHGNGNHGAGSHGNSRARTLSVELSVIDQAVSSRAGTPVDVVSLEDCLARDVTPDVTGHVTEVITEPELITDADTDGDPGTDTSIIMECVQHGSDRSSVDSTIDVETVTRDPRRESHREDISVLSELTNSPKVYTNLENCKRPSSSSISEEIDVISTSPIDVTSTSVDVISSSVIDVNNGSLIDVTSTSPIDVTSTSPIDVTSTSNIDVTSASPIDVIDVSLDPILTSTSDEVTCPKSPQFDIDVDSVTDAEPTAVVERWRRWQLNLKEKMKP